MNDRRQRTLVIETCMPLATGKVFAGYTIVRWLGSGAMGEVYLAEHPRLPRQDALKVKSTVPESMWPEIVRKLDADGGTDARTDDEVEEFDPWGGN